MAIIIDNESLKKLHSLKINAERTRLSLDDIFDIYNGYEKPILERDEFSCVVFNHRVSYSIEYSAQYESEVRHLSITSHPLGRFPNPLAIELLMKELGFHERLEDEYVYFERDKIINIVEPIK